MLGEVSLGETILGGETLDLGAPIILGVAMATKTLVFVVEMDFFQFSDVPSETGPNPADGFFWDDGQGWGF